MNSLQHAYFSTQILEQDNGSSRQSANKSGIQTFLCLITHVFTSYIYFIHAISNRN